MDNRFILGIAIGIVAVGAGVLILSKKRKTKQERIKYDILKFSDVVELASKRNKIENLKEHEIVVLLREQDYYVLTVYDKMSENVLDDNTLIIETNRIDENLLLAFNNTNMIVFEG
ncbi:hypothetical protein NWE55_14225 [Myroides albus]|uniref:hypothetical protein n=1 Tax=Myroides albus TaxID=2562892 RepID=UPI002159B12B|nr:hypothetical protein [Myroides albus]UVD79271.1 hypothetical protein NWE55_14225 [Myroides albus]